MATHRKFELKIKTGKATVYAKTFPEADKKLAKAIKAVSTRWDVDFYCREEVDDEVGEKPFEVMMTGSVVIEGNSFMEAEKLFYTALESVSPKYDVTIDQGEVTTIYDPPRRVGGTL